MSSQNVQNLLKDLEERNEKFEESLRLFTTGAKEVTLKHVDGNFKELKTVMKKLRQHSRGYKK